MNFHKNHWLLFAVTCFGFIGLSLSISILPAIWVQNNAEPLPGSQPLTALEHEGLRVYISEGCVACHTQQVRPLPVDEPWGRPATAGDFAHVTALGPWAPYGPAVLGSERTGPDLTNVGARQASDIWQYIHLYNPRSVVPDSVMPAYPWLFTEVKTPAEGQTVVPVPAAYTPKSGLQVVPNQRGEALVAYLLSLKQLPLDGPAEPAAAAVEEAPAPAVEEPAAVEEEPVVEQAPAAEEAQAASQEAAAEEAPEAPAATVAAVIEWDEALGNTTYASTCAACHQASGEGVPGAFPPLKGDPVVTADDPTEHIGVVLHGRQGSVINGVSYASPMPAFEFQLNDEQVAAVINHERTSWGNDAPLVTPADVAAVRGGTQ